MQQQRTNWWSRNWKWVVPIGCLGIVLFFAAFAAGIIAIAMGALKSNTPYRQSVAQATSNPAVIEKLGTPIKPGFWVSGSVKSSDGGGRAVLHIPIAGPRGKAKIHSFMTKNPDEPWVMRRLTVAPESGSVIVIVEGDGTMPVDDDTSDGTSD